VNSRTLASLLIPTLQWDATSGFDNLRSEIDKALEIGVGGFLVRGGPRQAVAALAAELHARSRIPLLLAADVERGAGEQFEGCTALPPFGAIGFIAGAASSQGRQGTPGARAASAESPVDDARRAARITAREMKLLGLNWALAPVCDLDVAPFCSIVGTRSAGANAQRVSAIVAEWIDGCQAEGVLACAKHFPGHGRAIGDSHTLLPVADASAEVLWRDDMAPFRAAIDTGVASIMTAHVAYPALDARGLPATLSGPLLIELLREEMEFDGLIVTDALDMQSVLTAGTSQSIATNAIAAGCDLLLAPLHLAGMAGALVQALSNGTLNRERVRDALDRRDRKALWGQPAPGREPTLDDVMWTRRAADRAVFLLRGRALTLGAAAELVIVDDDADGDWPAPSRDTFVQALRSLELDAPVVAEPTPHTKVPVIVAVFADVAAGKDYAGLSESGVAAVSRAVAVSVANRREVCVVLFSHPRHAQQIPDAGNVLCAWGGEAPMQAAAARVLVRIRN